MITIAIAVKVRVIINSVIDITLVISNQFVYSCTLTGLACNNYNINIGFNVKYKLKTISAFFSDFVLN